MRNETQKTGSIDHLKKGQRARRCCIDCRYYDAQTGSCRLDDEPIRNPYARNKCRYYISKTFKPILLTGSWRFRNERRGKKI